MGIFCGKPIQPVSSTWHALVTAAQDRDLAATRLQSARELFDDRRLARAADRQVPDADDQTTKRALAEKAFPVEIKPELNETFVNKRERVKNSAQDTCAKAMAPLENDVDSELIQIFKTAAHGGSVISGW